MVRSILFSAALIASGSCAVAPTYLARYTKRGATQEEFMKDRYECMQEARGRVSRAQVNPYGGAAESTIETDCGVWFACLGARGYRLDPKGELAVPGAMAVGCSP